MSGVFVRRTTAILLVVIAALVAVCVGLIVYTFASSHGDLSGSENSEKLDIKLSGNINKKTRKMQQRELTQPWEKDLRLPKSTLPYHYDLTLFPNLKTEKFSGEVTITIGVTESMDYLLTHIKHMNIEETILKDSSGNTVELKNSFEYEPNQFWVVRPNLALVAGNYTLFLRFNGNLKGHIVGFYTSEYMTSSGEKRTIATSKFQPADARRAFPCFDEPSFKSTFKTTLIRPSEGYIALSNMPVQNEIANSPEPGFTKVEFEKSVPMVTYLTCFIVCDFEYVETMTDDGKPFRVYATKDQIHRTLFARDMGVATLNYFEKYFEVEYPLPKQDMIAIPDFISGAMEHWGLITYRETNLLYDAVNSSSYNNQRVASVVAHELAHMWFGNLVTLDWWDDLWLNEGFASYIEYKGVDNYEKNWEMLDQFLTSDLHDVMKTDAILSSHPIVQTVNMPNEITELFDKITYSKGSSVLRMLENFLGDENFRLGVRNFLRRFKYGNAITKDLWDDLQKTAPEGLNVARIMDTWTRQMGLPVVTVKISLNDPNQLEVTQRRFLADPEANGDDDSPFKYKWDIPITYKTASSPRKQIWMQMEQNKLLFSRPTGDRWIKLNVDQYGYYRVNYETKLWQELIDILSKNHEMLSSADRANLIDDSFALAAAKYISYDIAFKVTSYLPKETRYVPWATAYNSLDEIGFLLENTEAYSYYRNYILNLVENHVKRIGWEDTGTHTERRLRIVILSLACDNGHIDCNEEAVRQFKRWIVDPGYLIPANLRTIIYKYGIKGTGEEEWNILLERYANELNAQEKDKMLTGLTSTREPWIINRMIDLARNESIVREQDFFSCLGKLSNNPTGLPIAWNFIRSNWEWLVDKFGLDNRYLGRNVKTVAEKFTSKVQQKELGDFFEAYPNAGAGKRARVQAQEKLQQNIKWIDNFSESLTNFFKSNSINF